MVNTVMKGVFMTSANGNDSRLSNAAVWLFRVILVVGLFGVIAYQSKRIDQISMTTERLQMDVVKAEVRTDYLAITVSKLPPAELLAAVGEIKRQVGENSDKIIRSTRT